MLNTDIIGIKKINNNHKINISPNPAHNQLTISAEQLTIENIEICDITGKVCKSNIPVRQKQIDISNLENGVYLLKIKTTDGSFVKRFVKE